MGRFFTFGLIFFAFGVSMVLWRAKVSSKVTGEDWLENLERAKQKHEQSVVPNSLYFFLLAGLCFVLTL